MNLKEAKQLQNAGGVFDFDDRQEDYSKLLEVADDELKPFVNEFIELKLQVIAFKKKHKEIYHF